MRKLTLLFFAGGLLFFCNCKKEDATAHPVTVTSKDTVHIRDADLIPALIKDTTTTFIIIRHAEKQTTGADPVLTSDGILRAEELKNILSKVTVHAIYTTPYNRTRQTVEPLSTAQSVVKSEYPTTQPYAQLVDDIFVANRGKVVVIVGHSNTVPEILKQISNGAFNISIAESQYDNLFIVTLPDKVSGIIKALKYGKETP